MNLLLEAALALAARGFKVFPVPLNSKKSFVRKSDRWASGENWGQTSDPALIRKYWEKWPQANIGLPTGATNGIVVIDTDTREGHPNLEVDGETSLQGVEVRLGPLPATWMSLSPTGSKHRFLAHPGGRVANSSGDLGPGHGRVSPIPARREGLRVAQ